MLNSSSATTGLFGNSTRLVPPSGLDRARLSFLLCLALGVATVLLYLPVVHHGFTNIDDDGYITANDRVRAGLTWPGVLWAFHGQVGGNWHPLTMLCLMLVSQLYGVAPAAYHVTSLLFHALNAVLLFVLLNKTTGAIWRSAVVAALFAWHPMHVESVAWAAELKDVLSGFFFMLTLLCYTQHTRCDKFPMAQGAAPSSFTFHVSLPYFLALLSFACGLMSKPMVVTLPFVLLLLDYWPLRRLVIGGAGSPLPAELERANGAHGVRALPGLILEKIPFFALAAAGSAIAYFTQKSGGAVWNLPFHLRAANALTACIRYISKMFWPVDLAIFYPYPRHWPVGFVLFAAFFLLIWSALFLLGARRWGYLLVGWCWFLGTLVPVIGLVQAGPQSMADRYTYIPSIGLFILVVWGASDLLVRRPHGQIIAGVAAAAVLLSLWICARRQLEYWRDSVTLCLRAIHVTEDNYLACDRLGRALEEMGRKDQALALYSESVQIDPTSPPGQFDLGMLLLECGRTAQASNHLAFAVQLKPGNPIYQYDFGMFLLLHGCTNDAANHFNAALLTAPDSAQAHNALAQIFHGRRMLREAVGQYRQALRSWPDYADALNGLAWILATSPDPDLLSRDESLKLAARACGLAQNQPDYLTTLSAAYAASGQFSNAITVAQKAGRLAQTAGQNKIVAKDQELLKCFESNHPFREN